MYFNEFSLLISVSLSLIGCLFHFGQSVWRHVQSKRLSKKYQEDDDFRSNIKKLIALAYLPLDDIIKGFDLVATEFDDDADDFLDYFEKTWIGEPKRRGKIFLSIKISILSLFLYRSRTKETTLRSQIMEHLRSCHR